MLALESEARSARTCVKERECMSVYFAHAFLFEGTATNFHLQLHMCASSLLRKSELSTPHLERVARHEPRLHQLPHHAQLNAQAVEEACVRDPAWLRALGSGFGLEQVPAISDVAAIQELIQR